MTTATATSNLAFDADVTLRLKRCLLDVLRLDLDPAAIDSQTNLYDLGLDSMSVVDLLVGIETEFKLTIEVDELSAELFGSFGNLESYIQARLEGVHA